MEDDYDELNMTEPRKCEATVKSDAPEIQKKLVSLHKYSFRQYMRHFKSVLSAIVHDIMHSWQCISHHKHTLYDRFSDRENNVLRSHYKKGMKGIGKKYSHLITSAATECALSDKQVMVGL